MFDKVIKKCSVWTFSFQQGRLGQCDIWTSGRAKSIRGTLEIPVNSALLLLVAASLGNVCVCVCLKGENIGQFML